MKTRGFTLMEVLIAATVSALLGAGLWTLIRSSYNSQWELLNQNTANANARQAIDLIVDDVRGLSTLEAASATSVAYTDSSGHTIRYWLNTSDNTLRNTIDNAPTGGTPVVMGVQSLAFTYWSWNGTTWVSSSSPATLTPVGQIDVSATVNLSGASRQVFSTTKLRQVRENNAAGF